MAQGKGVASIPACLKETKLFKAEGPGYNLVVNGRKVGWFTAPDPDSRIPSPAEYLPYGPFGEAKLINTHQLTIAGMIRWSMENIQPVPLTAQEQKAEDEYLESYHPDGDDDDEMDDQAPASASYVYSPADAYDLDDKLNY